ncbi:MAG: hypothetical protein R3F37_22470 [Candidatus Competibacteraceae bacterium]
MTITAERGSGGRSAYPCELGGIPLDEIGATGWGISHVAEVALEFCDFDLEGARVVVQGFGAVGRHAARFLGAKGAILVGAADSRGTLYNPKGLNVAALMELKQDGRAVIDCPDGERLDRDAVIDLDCDIWIPAARPDVIHEGNVHRLNTVWSFKAPIFPSPGGGKPVTPTRRVMYSRFYRQCRWRDFARLWNTEESVRPLL